MASKKAKLRNSRVVVVEWGWGENGKLGDVNQRDQTSSYKRNNFGGSDVHSMTIVNNTALYTQKLPQEWILNVLATTTTNGNYMRWGI